MHQYKKVEFDELIEFAWQLVKANHIDYSPSDNLDSFTRGDIISQLLEPVREIDKPGDVPMYYFRIEPENTIDNSTVEFRYSIILPDEPPCLYYIFI